MPRPADASVTHQRSRGGAALRYAVARGATRLVDLHQAAPMRILFPDPGPGEAPLAALVNTAGGMAGGDSVAVEVTLDPGAHAVVSTPAAEKIYRSLGPETVIEARLSVGAGATLEWLPQETILFEGARLHRSLDVDLEEGASLFALEAILLGREAMGEAARNARLRDDWRIRRNGRLIHAEATRLNADPLERDGLSLLDGKLAFATLLYVGADAERKLDLARPLLGSEAGASLVGERLVVRALAAAGLALRRTIAPIIAELSGAGALPRLWHM